MNPIHSDLALEAAQLFSPRGSLSAEAVRISHPDDYSLPVDKVEVLTAQGAQQIGKPIGTYLTLTVDALLHREHGTFAQAAQSLAQLLRSLMPPCAGKGCVLIAGLGNRAVTPDSIGPRAVEHCLITRHIQSQFGGFRSVCALSPGVLGTTGMESAELIRAAVQTASPGLVIAVDALSARSVGRLCTTVQLTDTGISPGSGVGNARAALDKGTLGVPVLAIGVPTVIDGGTFCSDLLGEDAQPPQEAAQVFVTPKDIDSLCSDLAKLIGYGISLALQENLTVEDLDLLLS